MTAGFIDDVINSMPREGSNSFMAFLPPFNHLSMDLLYFFRETNFSFEPQHSSSIDTKFVLVRTKVPRPELVPDIYTIPSVFLTCVT